jgi:acetolactate synthase-1/2/3 large subunit
MNVSKLGNVATWLGLLSVEADTVVAGCRPGMPVPAVLDALLVDPTGTPHALALCLLRRDRDEAIAAELAGGLGVDRDDVAEAVEAYLDTAAAQEPLLTGAEAIAVMLAEAGVRTVFAYAGTSELSLCDAVARVPELTLVNGRGDKEAAFMAAGASLLSPNRGAAILHGARGLTNAAGAVADARRNEAPTVFLVGLPSTGSAPFLPPHAEPDLVSGIGGFAKWWHEVPGVPAVADEWPTAAAAFVAGFWAAVDRAQQKPYGPTLFCVPQDVAEAAWIPWQQVVNAKRSAERSLAPQGAIHAAALLVHHARRPLILVDDYLMRPGGATTALADLATRAGAPVLQVRYRRGPMLFERLSRESVPTFLGWFDPDDEVHRRLLAETDLLVTVEDRNLYPRIVGDLPPCRKLAITSDADKARKNGYLGTGDLVVEDDPVATMHRVEQALSLLDGNTTPPRWAATADVPSSTSVTPVVTPMVEAVRSGIVAAIADAMAKTRQPVVVDDSQMFGGLISEYYDRLPAGTRIFGGHGGFVGAGISYATGLALSGDTRKVFCFLGDQAFTNNVQGLVVARERSANAIYLVCNNGHSVSLLKQSSTRPRWLASGHTYLHNATDLDYTRIAAGFGIPAAAVNLRAPRTLDEAAESLDEFRQLLDDALSTPGPALIEMRLPPLGEFWNGIWTVTGFE